MKAVSKLISTISLATLAGCVSAADHASQLHSAQDRALTVGIVQKEIHTGMSQADVATALGSPNIVSKDSSNQETWIYDKIASEASYSRSRGDVAGGVGSIAPIGSVLLLGFGTGSYAKEAGASATTQRTLTVVIKFDTAGRVTTANYHSSQF